MSVLREAKGDGDDGPTCTARSSGCHHDSSSTEAFDDEVCHEGEEEVVHRSSCRKDAGEKLAEADCVDEDVSHIIRRNI